MARLTKADKLKFAKKLEKNTPNSELWFRSLYFRHYSTCTDKYNQVFGGCIPDVINKTYKYIIEIDGSVHELESVKKKDIKKTHKYVQLGYKVIRVKAYDYDSYIKAINKLVGIRGGISRPTKEYYEFLKHI